MHWTCCILLMKDGLVLPYEKDLSIARRELSNTNSSLQEKIVPF